jgi:acylphosphatase
MIARRVVVSGRVQGVWFRDTCQRLAHASGLSGWVRNRDDGRVEAHVEGPPESVEALVAWCHEGPPRARVDDVEVHEQSPVGASGFEIVD